MKSIPGCSASGSSSGKAMVEGVAVVVVMAVVEEVPVSQIRAYKNKWLSSLPVCLLALLLQQMALNFFVVFFQEPCVL